MCPEANGQEHVKQICLTDFSVKKIYRNFEWQTQHLLSYSLWIRESFAFSLGGKEWKLIEVLWRNECNKDN